MPTTPVTVRSCLRGDSSAVFLVKEDEIGALSDRVTDGGRFTEIQLMENFREQIGLFDLDHLEESVIAQGSKCIQSRFSVVKFLPDQCWCRDARELGSQE